MSALEFFAGVGERSEALGEWLDAHPWAALAVVVAAFVLSGLA